MGVVHHHWVTLSISHLLSSLTHKSFRSGITSTSVTKRRVVVYSDPILLTVGTERGLCGIHSTQAETVHLQESSLVEGRVAQPFWAPSGLPSGSPILLTEGASGAAALWLSSASALFPTSCAHPFSAVVWMCLLQRPLLQWAVLSAYWLFLWRQHVTARKEKNPIADVVSRWIRLFMSTVLLTQASNFCACVLQFWPTSAVSSLSLLRPLFLGKGFQFLFLPIWEVLFFEWQLLNF